MHPHGTYHSIYVSSKNINSMIKWWKFSLFIKKYFYEDFPQLDLKNNTLPLWCTLLKLLEQKFNFCTFRRFISGVLFSLVFMLMSAPALSNSRVSSLLFSLTVMCNGTFLNLSCLFTSAPSSSRRLTTSVRWLITAAIRAVRPFSLHTSTGTPSRNIWSIFLTSPTAAKAWYSPTRARSNSRYEKWLVVN